MAEGGADSAEGVEGGPIEVVGERGCGSGGQHKQRKDGNDHSGREDQGSGEHLLFMSLFVCAHFFLLCFGHQSVADGVLEHLFDDRVVGFGFTGFEAEP